MQFILPTGKIPFTLQLGVQTRQPENIRVVTSDNRKRNTLYTNREFQVNMTGGVELKLPVPPEVLVVNVWNASHKFYKTEREDPSFKVVKFDVTPLKTWEIWLSKQDREFIKFAQEFSERAGYLSASHPNGYPSVYASDNEMFYINYFDKIIDKKTGKAVGTPARIGHQSGRIDVSKSDFITYTVPVRMIILLHEYCHKFKNPMNGFKIGNEQSADILAAQIYLSLGYSENEAMIGFAKVFMNANSLENQKRLLILRDFCKKFLAGTLPTK